MSGCECYSCILPESPSGDRVVLSIPESVLSEEERVNWIDTIKIMYSGDIPEKKGVLLFKLKFAMQGQGAFAKYIVSKK